MKILIVGTSIFTLPPSGYSGLENLVYTWGCQFAKEGHQVSVVAPTGSTFPPELNIELIATNLGEGEDVSYGRYKDRLIKGDWDCCMDNSWFWFSALAQQEADHQLPIIHCYHSDPNNLGSPPPIAKPCLVAFSEAQANIIRRKWSCAVNVVHHGIDLNFYKPDPNVKRGDRYLFLARYTSDKGFLDIAYLAKRCRVPLDAYGDTTIISSDDYMRKCFEENDGRQIRVMPGISREEVVKQFQSHKALITWPNYCEIFGLATVESLSCGCPVISKDSGAASELIRQAKSGFVVSTLEEAEELITSGKIDTIRSEDCVKQASKFSIAKSAEGHLKLLQSVADGLFW